jgi:hypothetical protein
MAVDVCVIIIIESVQERRGRELFMSFSLSASVAKI